MYERVLIPPAVRNELQVVPPPAQAVDISTLPWLNIVEPQNRALVTKLHRLLDSGESEAIALSQELPSNLLLLDDLDARVVATTRRLSFTGTIGLLLAAKAAGHIPLVAPMMDRLRTGIHFRIGTRLYRQALLAAGE